MNKQFTANEVRDLAKRGTDAIQQFIYGRYTLHIPPQSDDADMVIAECLRAMGAFADLLEAQEKAGPVAYAEFADNGCVRVWSREYEERLPGTRMVPLYTHSSQARPAAASVTDEMVMRLKHALPLFCADVTMADARAALEAALAAQESLNG